MSHGEFDADSLKQMRSLETSRSPLKWGEVFVIVRDRMMALEADRVVLESRNKEDRSVRSQLDSIRSYPLLFDSLFSGFESIYCESLVPYVRRSL